MPFMNTTDTCYVSVLVFHNGLFEFSYEACGY